MACHRQPLNSGFHGKIPGILIVLAALTIMGAVMVAAQPSGGPKNPAAAAGAALSNHSPLNVKVLGARGDGLADDTKAIQDALDKLAAMGGRIYLPAGTYLVGPLYFPARVIIEGDGDATVLKFHGTSGFMLSPKVLTTSNQFVHIRDLALDMQGKANVGILLTNCWHSSVRRVNIRNLSTGTYKVDNRELPNAGIALLATAKVSGAYYNTLEQCFVQGVKANYGNTGIYLSCSSESDPRGANFNRLIQCRTLYCQTGINLNKGNDVYVEMPEVSACEVGIRVKVRKGYLFKPYAEACDTGILLEKESWWNVVMLSGSFSGTRLPINDEGKENTILLRARDFYEHFKKEPVQKY